MDQQEQYSTQLLVMRHGEAQVYAQNDHQRALTDRGQQEVLENAKNLANLLASLTRPSLKVLVSDALRTKETWSIIDEYLRAQTLSLHQIDSVNEQSSLYLAPSSFLQKVISDTQMDSYEQMQNQKVYLDQTPVILLIAHNPGLSDLIYDLAGHWMSLKTAQMIHLEQKISFEPWKLRSLGS